MNYAYRQTYGSVKDTIGIPIGMCGTDPQLLPLVNEACQLLWNAGDYIHKFARYRLRLTQNCQCYTVITWPTEVETIEAMEMCGSPIGVRTVYFEFAGNVGPRALGAGYGPGYGYGGNGDWGGVGVERLLGDRQEVCTMEDVQSGGGKKIKAYNSLPADDGAQIILLGYDDSLNWIRTLQNGVYADGEALTLNAATPPETTNFFSSITGVQFSTTPRNGDVTITQVNTLSGNTERWLSTYAYNEEIPIYRRSVLSGGFNYVNNGENGQPTCYPSVTALCRLRYIPIRFDSDYMQIGNISALKEMLLSLQKRSNGKFQDAEAYKMRATKALDDELRQYQGVGPKKIVNWTNRFLWGAAPNLR